VFPRGDVLRALDAAGAGADLRARVASAPEPDAFVADTAGDFFCALLHREDRESLGMAVKRGLRSMQSHGYTAIGVGTSPAGSKSMRLH
jgi:hypothetical protein